MIGRSDWLTHPRAVTGARRLCDGFAAGDVVAVLAGAVALAGLGEGSTPSGDDFLIGAMHALWSARPRDEASRLSAAAVDVAAARTTALSARWLLAAARGDASPPWRRLLDARRHGHEPELEAATAAVLRTGHTSGAASLAGFVQCLAAISGPSA